ELAERLDDGLLVVGREGEVRAANGAAERLLATSRLALIGRSLADVLPGPAAGALSEACGGGGELRLSVVVDGRALALRIVPRAEDAWLFLRPEPVQPAPSQDEHLRTILQHAP